MIENNPVPTPDLPPDDVAYQDVPRLDNIYDSQALNNHLAEIWKSDGVPAVVVSEKGWMPSETPRGIGATALRALTYHGNPGFGFRAETSVARPIASSRHVDGIAHGTFAQIHTNIATEGNPHSEVTLEVRKLGSEAQKDMHAIYGMEGMRHDRSMTSRLSVMPDSVKDLSEVVARYRTVLKPGESIIFRNGFTALHPTEDDKLLTTHSFRSVDEEGNPIPVKRETAVGYVARSGKVKLPGSKPKRRFLRRKAAA